MAEKDGHFFGVYFNTEDKNIDEVEVKNFFSKYGRLAFVKNAGSRIYINFRTKVDAENCLLDAVNCKFGVVKRGKFPESKNSSNGINNNKNTDRFSFPQKEEKFDRKSRTSLAPPQSSDSTYGGLNARNRNAAFGNGYQNTENKLNHGSRSPRRSNDSGHGKNNKRYQNNSGEENEYQMKSDSLSVSQHRKSEKIFSGNESKHYSSDSPPPLLSINDGPPPLLSHDDDGPPPLLSHDDDDGPPPLLSAGDGWLPSPADYGPPPLISAVEPQHSNQSKPLMNSSPRRALLPTPPASMRLDYNPERTFSSSQLPVHKVGPSCDDSDIPPPLISIDSHSEQTQFPKNSFSQLSYDDYIQKYGNYLIIANTPSDTTPDEIEKVLYPHIPLCVSDAEETNKKKVLFCVVSFKTCEEAKKAAKQLDGVELREHCLSMIRLDELIMFSDEPF